MRVMGFSRKWEKLSQPVFSTFRLPRKDRGWSIGEQVQIVYRPRSKDREILTDAAIILNVESRSFNPRMAPKITQLEAIADGFVSVGQMQAWLEKAHGHFNSSTIFNKLTIGQVQSEVIK